MSSTKRRVNNPNSFYSDTTRPQHKRGVIIHPGGNGVNELPKRKRGKK